MKCSRSVVAKRSRRKKRFSSWTAGVSRAISSRKAAFSFRGMDRDLDEAQTSALFGVTPLETILGRIVAFAQATEGYASPIAGPKAARASAAALPGSSNDAVFLLAA
jgi:hypothetical protein